MSKKVYWEYTFIYIFQETDARIIIGAFYENQARLVFCEVRWIENICLC